MISSTVLDLPEHRGEVRDACLRQGMFPNMMEHLPASDIEAMAISLKLVNESDIYIGVFAHRYGYVPKEHNPRQISVTEMEYTRAVERGIPRLIFLMHGDHRIKASDVEKGEAAVKLEALKLRLGAEHFVNFFTSPADLRADVINSLSQLRQPDLTTFHDPSDIPRPPEAFVAHPYTLLETHRLVGRRPELDLLTDWVAKPDAEIYKSHILNVVAVGGLGKSALTWKWFNDIAPQEMSPLSGRLWWSFYESGATFENFVTRAFAYVTRRPLDEAQRIPAPDRETQLLAALDREPFLLVLDGLERVLIAYARMDAAHLDDDDLDQQTADFAAHAHGPPAGAAQSFAGERRLCKTADPRAGSFLRKLSNVRASRILVSTRLYPADLQTGTGEPRPGCSALFLPGLSDDDALELWRAFGVSGASDTLLRLFRRVGGHPLSIQALASEVAYYRPAPGDFDEWGRGNPNFDPFVLPLVQVKSHVLKFALSGLDDKARQVLQVISAFRMPARYDTLAALLEGKGKVCAGARELDAVLTELEDRGLVGWDKRANRYDLHPVVRGVVWSGMGDDARRGVYASLRAHFESLPQIDDYRKVNSLEDLTPDIELYNTLIGLGRYDDACQVFLQRLSGALQYRLSASRQQVELLEMLFPDGLEELPRLSSSSDQGCAVNDLAVGYLHSGRPGRASQLLRRVNTLVAAARLSDNLGAVLVNLSYALRLSGSLCKAEAAARRAVVITRAQKDRLWEAVNLQWLGLTLGARGIVHESASALNRALRIGVELSHHQGESYVNSYLAQRAVWLAEFAAARTFANRAWELALVPNFEGDVIRAARVQGEAALGLSDFAAAEERLHHALTRARKVNLAEEELPALVALAELRRRQGEAKAARELLDDVWEAAERGPYPLIHADACNVLAQVERDAGNEAAAVEAATEAYRLAWCDGPPFAYHWGLEKARGHLRELGASEPGMPAFDVSKFEAMPEVEIDPEDEFHAGRGGGELSEDGDVTGTSGGGE